MKRRGYAVLIGVLAGLLCLAVVHVISVPQVEHGKFTLWYAEEDCPRSVMESLLADYRQETHCLIEAVAYPDEAALGEAFENGRPDLLLCSHVRAIDLDRRAPLKSTGQLPPLPSRVEEFLPATPGCYWPVGGRVPLLLYDAEKLQEPPESLEALLRFAEEAGKPVLAAESWSELLQAGMLSRGKKLHGAAEMDRAEKTCIELYNALAAAVFAGGVGETDDPTLCVRQGKLTCAIVPSTALAGLGEDGPAVAPLPLPEKGETVYSAELLGFAFLGDEDAAKEAADFLTWLAIGNRSAALALSAGLVPLTAPEEEPETPLQKLLCELSAGDSLRFLDADSDYCKNRSALESRLRQGLDLLR